MLYMNKENIPMNYIRARVYFLRFLIILVPIFIGKWPIKQLCEPGTPLQTI